MAKCNPKTELRTRCLQTPITEETCRRKERWIGYTLRQRTYEICSWSGTHKTAQQISRKPAAYLKNASLKKKWKGQLEKLIANWKLYQKIAFNGDILLCPYVLKSQCIFFCCCHILYLLYMTCHKKTSTLRMTFVAAFELISSYLRKSWPNRFFEI